VAVAGAATLLPGVSSSAARQAPAGSSQRIGTDTPLASLSGTVAGVQTSGLSAEERRGIYRENLLRILPDAF
jgi:hypothetical protein